MAVSRRAAIAALISAPAVAVDAVAQPPVAGAMYGLIAKMRAKPGQRDALIDILAAATTIRRS